MKSSNPRGYGWSFVGHLVAGLLVTVLGMVHGLSCQRRPKELVLPIEFLVDTTQLEEEPEPPVPEKITPDEPPPPPPPKPDPKKEEPKKPDVKKPDVKKPDVKKPPVNVSTAVVHRVRTPKPLPKPTVKKPTGPKLSPEEIAKLLAMGAKASDRTVIPGEDERALAILKNALYAAWIRPTNDQKGRRPAQIELRVDRFGVVTGRRLLQSSGSPAMDASVERAAAAVRQVLKLPAGFTDRFPAVIIEFELE